MNPGLDVEEGGPWLRSPWGPEPDVEELTIGQGPSIMWKPSEGWAGPIVPDSILGGAYGFTSERFSGWLFFRQTRKEVYISLIESLQPGQGHLSHLFGLLWADGYLVKVPTPLDRMLAIVRHKGFRSTLEMRTRVFSADALCKVWVK